MLDLFLNLSLLISINKTPITHYYSVFLVIPAFLFIGLHQVV